MDLECAMISSAGKELMLEAWLRRKKMDKMNLEVCITYFVQLILRWVELHLCSSPDLKV